MTRRGPKIESPRTASVCHCGDHAWFALTRGYVTVVGVEDVHFAGRRWHARVDDKVYAKRSDGEALHRIILSAPEEVVVDHVNGNSLDNRRFNLRSASLSQNSINVKKLPGGSSKFKGVFRFRDGFMSQITVRRKKQYLGTFASEVEAAMAYDVAAFDHFGEFAVLNFPQVASGARQRSSLPSPTFANAAASNALRDPSTKSRGVAPCPIQTIRFPK